MGAFNRLLMASYRGGSLLRRGFSSTTASRAAPWLMLPSNQVADTFTSDAEVCSMDYSFYRLSDKKTISLRNKSNGNNPIPHDAFCVGSSKGWLLYSDPGDCTLFLTNPLVSPSPPTIPLPRVTTLPYIRPIIGCSPKYNKTELGRFLLTHEKFLFPPQKIHARIISNFSISSSSPDSQDCVIMVIMSGTNELSFCKPGLNMEAWTNLINDPLEPFYAIVYSSKDQLFYTLFSDGGIVTWDLRNHLEPKREAYHPVFTDSEDYPDTWFTNEYLVESSGDILLVRWHHSNYVDREGNVLCDALDDYDVNLPHRTLRFDVYRLNDGKDSWQRMESLGDRVLFLGMNEPFSLSASDFPELKPNSIYFSTGCAWEVAIHSASDWGIYNLKDHTVTCHYPCSYWSKLRPPPIWIQIQK